MILVVVSRFRFVSEKCPKSVRSLRARCALKNGSKWLRIGQPSPELRTVPAKRGWSFGAAEVGALDSEMLAAVDRQQLDHGAGAGLVTDGLARPVTAAVAVSSSELRSSFG